MKQRAFLLMGAGVAALLALAYAAPQSILGLQMQAVSVSTVLRESAGTPGWLSLTNLNPAVNAGFLLRLQAPGQGEVQNYHVQNAAPDSQQLLLRQELPGQLLIRSGGQTFACPVWPEQALQLARKTGQAFAPLCGGRLFLRNSVHGSGTALENTTQFLRDYVWQGERIVGVVRKGLYQDSFEQRAEAADSAVAVDAAAARGAPAAGQVLASLAATPLKAAALGIDLGAPGGLLQGQWYTPPGLPGVYVSMCQPAAMLPDQHSAGLSLDAVESVALSYLVAFDLAAFELGFSLGTEHPRLGWSERVLPQMREDGLAGPDGIDSALPLVRTGMLSPALLRRTVATFTGGFKRAHGAFRYGELATRNHGSHYGFVEDGVVYSSLQPGLSTLYVGTDGQTGMKTWTVQDGQDMASLRQARQNGVPLLERAATGAGAVPGPLLDAWGAGNWSGSTDEQLRSLRAGACLIEQGARRFLVYGYFSSATPRAMARVFLAYGCRYAMHLDMNALEHTYLALYLWSGERLRVEHLVAGMEVLDRGPKGSTGPRFLGFPDNRDFFYLSARRPAP